ncbi:MAG: ribosome-binding factor A [Maribacter sp.]|jgi:ribosome-binding factor A
MAKQMTKRQRQVAEIIRRNLSVVLQQEGTYIYGDALVTVTNIVLTPDMLNAKIYLSIYNTENKQAVLLMMREEKNRLQQGLAQRVRNQMRRVPRIAFYEDDTMDEMYRINDLFKKLEDEDQLGRNRSEEKDEEEELD